ncbi:MAG TPA: lamin tail domain-containing protein, partial [Clostridia bacterium]|nr:lamin tail domain-containing protein [Clostridia bacterium]
CTFVYGFSRVIYNTGGQYSGSPWHSPGYDTPIGNVCDYLLTFPEDAPLLGETEATLQWPGNGGGDNTYQREQTAYWLAEQVGLPYCYRRSINLLINGVRRAELFEDVQQPNGDMTDEFYPDGEDGDLHKVQIWWEFDDAAVGFTSVGASLQNYITTGGKKKLPVYRWTFAKRAIQDSASNYTNLFALVDAVNFSGLGANYRRQLETQMDVDNWLKTYAIEHVVGNGDSFAYGGGQNMYIYKPRGDTWKMMIWDIDFAFWAQPPDSDMFAGIGRSCGVDLGEPAYLRRYWQILQDLATGPLVASKATPILDARYNAMTSSGRIVDNPAPIKDYIAQRRSYLLNLISTKVPTGFTVKGNGTITDRNWLSLSGTAPIDVRTITINGMPVPVTWTSVSNWTVQVALAGGVNALTFQGWDASSHLVAGASNTINVTVSGPVELPQDKLVINEIMYHPAAPNASFIELYNTSTLSAFDLSGWRLEGVDFVFPSGTIIGPGGFLVVAADRLAFAAAYGGSIPVAGEFGGKLENNGETLRLIKPNAPPVQDLVVDEVRYDSEAPWPAVADGAGPSLQLIDATKDNSRVANWGAAPTNALSSGPQWRYVTVTGTASSSTLYMYLHSAGDVYIDDLKLVAGAVAESGPNLLANGDFEGTFPGAWGVAANMSPSAFSTTIKHSGNASLHLVATSGGSSRSSSIYQDISPSLVANDPYTLSFWYLENPNGGTLTLRLSGSGIAVNVNLAAVQPVEAQRFTPGRANSLAASLSPLPPLWLNEISPQNLSGITDRFGHRHPWVELYNSGTTNLSLNGCFLANNYTNLMQWAFPAGITVGPGKFLLVYLDDNPGESTTSELHTGFTVATNLGALALVSTNGGRTNVLDYLNYTVKRPDRTYGAYPDGTAGKRREFYFSTPANTNNAASPPLDVVINEWMADNKTTTADEADDDFEDWFELYNSGDTTADLSGYFLGVSLTNRTKFLIPDGYSIPPKGYLLVWADEETGQNRTNRADLHVNFKLSKAGDAIGLFAPDGSIIDYIYFGQQATDITEGRFPDGPSTIDTLSTPTPRAANLLLAANMPPTINV